MEYYNNDNDDDDNNNNNNNNNLSKTICKYLFFKSEICVLKICISFSHPKATILPYMFFRRHSHLVTSVPHLEGRCSREPF
jgi:hypothetical protein